jgi:glycerol uptake facilitator-like aquaporin
MADLSRRLACEFLGTLFLLAAVVGSGIMAEQLSVGNTALALLANTFATSGILVILILSFGPVSAHFNPAVSLVMMLRGELRRRELPLYVLAQFAGAFAGVFLAHVMFELPAFAFSLHDRHGLAKMVSESVATFGLVGVILSCAAHRKDAVPYAVAAYIGSAYWFTASTSFANPAVTLARAATDTFSGIRPVDVPGFLAAQLVGAIGAAIVFGWLFPQSLKLADK